MDCYDKPISDLLLYKVQIKAINLRSGPVSPVQLGMWTMLRKPGLFTPTLDKCVFLWVASSFYV